MVWALCYGGTTAQGCPDNFGPLIHECKRNKSSGNKIFTMIFMDMSWLKCASLNTLIVGKIMYVISEKISVQSLQHHNYLVIINYLVI